MFELLDLGVQFLAAIAAAFALPVAIRYLIACWQAIRTAMSRSWYTISHAWVARCKRHHVIMAIILTVFYYGGIASAYRQPHDPWFWGPMTAIFLSWLWMFPIRHATSEERELARQPLIAAETALTEIQAALNTGVLGVTQNDVNAAMQFRNQAQQTFNNWLIERGPSDRSPGDHYTILYVASVVICMNVVITGEHMHENHDLFYHGMKQYRAFASETYSFANTRLHVIGPSLVMFTGLMVVPCIALIGVNHLFVFVGTHLENMVTMTIDALKAAFTPSTYEQVRKQRFEEMKARGHGDGTIIPTATEALGYRLHGIVSGWLVGSFFSICVLLQHALYTTTLRSFGYTAMTSAAVSLVYLTAFNPNIRRERLAIWFTVLSTVTAYPPLYYFWTGGNGYGGGPGPYHWILRIPHLIAWAVMSVYRWIVSPAKAIGHYVAHDLTGMGWMGALQFLLILVLVGAPMAAIIYGASKLAKKIESKPFLYLYTALIAVIAIPACFACAAAILQVPIASTAEAAAARRTAASTSASSVNNCPLLNGKFPCTVPCLTAANMLSSPAGIQQARDIGRCY